MVEEIKNIFIKELRQIIAQYGIFVNRQFGCTRVPMALNLNFQGGVAGSLEIVNHIIIGKKNPAMHKCRRGYVI
jgi:hypothetical protein